MPFFLLILLIALLQVRWQPPPMMISPLEGALCTWLGTGMVVAGTFIAVWFARRALNRDPSKRQFLLRRYAAWRLYNLLGISAAFGLSIYLLGWGWLIQEHFANGSRANEDLPPLLPGAEILILAPFLVGLVSSFAVFYDLEKALHDQVAEAQPAALFWQRWPYVAFHARHNLGLACAPLLLMIFVKDLPPFFPAWLEDRPLGAGILLFGGALCLFVGMPWMVRLVLGLKPLPSCPLRDQLLSCARRLNFRCSNILVWDTRGGIANAMVVGIVPWIRYVIFTDRLIGALTTQEVEAVFGHEIGHVKHRHMLYYLAFLVGSLAIVTQVWERVDLHSALGIRQDLLDLPLFTTIGAYIFLVFGFLSRRCERQADVYGCRAVSCSREYCVGHDDAALVPRGRGLCPTGIQTFISALEKVAYLNGISRERPGWLQSWQHSTIARRVDFLQKMIREPQIEARFQSALTRLKWSSVLVLGVLLLLVGQKWGWSGLLSF
jgi:Zn-dependent protease with chaperone function